VELLAEAPPGSKRAVRRGTGCAQGLVYFGYEPTELLDGISVRLRDAWDWEAACSLAWTLAMSSSNVAPDSPALTTLLEGAVANAAQAQRLVEEDSSRQTYFLMFWQLWLVLQATHPALAEAWGAKEGAQTVLAIAARMWDLMTKEKNVSRWGIPVILDPFVGVYETVLDFQRHLEWCMTQFLAHLFTFTCQAADLILAKRGAQRVCQHGSRLRNGGKGVWGLCGHFFPCRKAGRRGGRAHALLPQPPGAAGGQPPVEAAAAEGVGVHASEHQCGGVATAVGEAQQEKVPASCDRRREEVG